MEIQHEKNPKWNITNFYTILAIYLIFIVISGTYIFYLQGFGSKGLDFSITGKYESVNLFDIALIIGTAASFFLVIISLLAFKKRKDNRIFILSVAFFLFALNQVIQIFDSFFPNEHLFINNAIKVISLLILLSFAMLILHSPKKLLK